MVQLLKQSEVTARDGEASERRDNVSGTVLRALALLDVLVAEPRGLGLSAAARRVGLNKATTHRLLASLERAGLVVQREPNGQYRPALKLVHMGEQVLQSYDLRTVAHPCVETLAREVGHAVLAGVLEGNEVAYVDHVDLGDGLRVHRQIGGRRSVHVSSIGKAILAHLPPAEADAVIAACRFERRTEHTIVDPAVYRAALREVRRQGWALVRDEDILGASSFSAPVFGHTGRVVGAIGIAGPSFLLRGEALDRSVGLLRNACRTVSAQLGYRGGA